MSRTFADSIATDLDAMFSVDEFARTYTLRRGQKTTTGLAAIVVSRAYDTPTREGMLTNVRSIDLDIVASAYELGGVATDPQRGDMLTDEDSEDVFEVFPLPGRQCWEPADDGLVIRVHVKQVA